MAEAIDKGLELAHASLQRGVLPSEHTKPDFKAGSIHTLEDCEQTAHESGLETTRSQPGVDVEQAEKDFAELSKSLSKQSQRLSRTYSRASRVSKAKNSRDVEKAVSSDESSQEDWSLEDTLRGAKQADLEAGIKQKHIGVIWDNLTVRGTGGVKNYVKVFPQAFVDFFNIPGTLMSIFGFGKKGREFNILNRFRGVAKPGEMVLVLGRPGSGCTTFLKVISNQRFGYTGIDGEVLYGPFNSQTFAKRYRGESVYCDEDDNHHPTLTVGQTLGFALDVKTPGKRPAGMSKAEFKDRVIKTLLKMFNIEHTINTIVGNPYMRGVSGGERKRVSIAEMMVVGATVCAWDVSTPGDTHHFCIPLPLSHIWVAMAPRIPQHRV
jgi:ATP-binding cassette subfamily G (WHITE) protein 2 (SNQ2)